MKKLLIIVSLFIVSFLILIKGSIVLYHHKYNYILCILISCSIIVLLNFITLKIMFKKIQFKWTAIIAYTILISYIIYCLYPRSTKNFANESIKKEYSDLHPILKLGVGTLFLLDRKSIMTDGSRTKEDCNRMNIQYKSDHMIHSDNYCYAVDLSVKNRSFLRNLIIGCYFRMLGLYTLRHDQGFGDHYHIALKSK